jgi:hypothetical protein
MTTATNAITTGIKTRINSEEPYGYIVEWINWDSPFRESGLQHADIIIGIDDKKYLKENKNSDHPKSPGNYLESSFFEEKGLRDGHTITLHIIRDGQSLSVTGPLHEQRVYLNSDQKMIMGDNGPKRLSNDGFSSAWSSWYEKFVSYLLHYIDDKRWERATLDNRRLLKEHQEWKERVDYLQQKYPGRFASMALADWEKVNIILQGNQYNDITDETLEYRKLGGQRVAVVREASIKARKTFLDSYAADCIPAFPAMDPVHGKLESVKSKKIVLPAITFEQFTNDLGKTFAVIGNSKDGRYFIHLNSPEMDVFFRTLFHYKAQVTPDVPERYEFVAEILQQPAIISFQGKPVTGLMVKAIAGMAGDDQVFIDLTQKTEKGINSFAGEEELTLFKSPSVGDAASPQEVIEAMIQYIKLGDMKSWRKLFCTWQIYSEWDGPPYMDMGYWMPEENYQNTWEKSKKQILNDVYDARVIYTSPIRTVVTENPETGVPNVEQVKIIVDHVGKFDGNYWSVSNLQVHRRWILQRLNGGPWKIKELQGL